MASEEWGEFILEKWLGQEGKSQKIVPINCRQDKRLIIVETAIHRVS
ncbi:hypothetical protein [Nostoc sp. NMS8]|nr:hypothetical protein [Nostoc sp. NMS8]MBN3957524.1 hypothetical protein [Nostoc sp. NMS8]